MLSMPLAGYAGNQLRIREFHLRPSGRALVGGNKLLYFIGKLMLHDKKEKDLPLR